MKHFYRLSKKQWLVVSVVAACWLIVFHDLYKDPIAGMILSIPFAFVLAYFQIQNTIHQRPEASPLTLILKTSSSKEADDALFEKLHKLFESNFPKNNIPKFDGFDCSKDEYLFYFKGANPDVIMNAIQPLLRDIPLPEGSHLIVKTGPEQSMELPVFAKV